MKFLTLPLLSTLFLAASAVPVTSDADAKDILKRSWQTCSIVSNDGPVRCRWEPSSTSRNHADLPDGTVKLYSCYKKGTCYKGNCTWDFIPSMNCYVNGYYTDGHCTAARLGLCS